MRVVVPTVKPAAVEETSVALGNSAPTIERMLDEADTYLRAVAAAPAFEGLHVLTTVRSGEAPAPPQPVAYTTECRVPMIVSDPAATRMPQRVASSMRI